MKKINKPPKIFGYILRTVIQSQDRESLPGDFEEMYHRISEESGRFMAFCWYLFQLIKLIPSFFDNSIFWSVMMFKNYLKIAFRTIIKQKVFSTINIIGLAISLSLSLFVVKLIVVMYSTDRFHENKDRIYRVTSIYKDKNHNISKMATAPLILADELQKLPEIEKTVRIQSKFHGNAEYQKKTLSIHGYFTDNSFFDVFSFELEAGDSKTALAEPNSIVLTNELAAKFFGNKNPVGEFFSIKGVGEFKITGVLKSLSTVKSHFNFECLTSAATLKILEHEKKITPCLQDWSKFTNGNYIYFLLKENCSLAKINNSLEQAVKKHYKKEEGVSSFQIQALTKISPGPRYSNQLGEPVPPEIAYIFSAIAFIITLIACLNYTNLSIAKALNRVKEIGIRKVIGAKRFDLFTQFISESVIISLIAFIFSLILLNIFEPRFYELNSIFYNCFYVEGHNIGLYFLFLLFTILTGIFVGFFPALYLSKFNPAHVLKDITKVKIFSRLTLRKALVVFQFFISLIFIITTTVFYKQIQFEQYADYGFNAGNIINVNLQRTNYSTFKNEISNYHTILKISGSAFLPNTNVCYGDWIKHENFSEPIMVNEILIDENFIENIDLKIIAGKNFPENLNSPNEKFTIINEKAVQQLGYKSPMEALGNIITVTAKKDINLEIIGVVKDFVYLNNSNPIHSLILRHTIKNCNYANVKINTDKPEATLAFLEEKWNQLYPDKFFKYNIYEEKIQETILEAKNMINAFGFIAFLAILIAFFGLLGMVIFDSESRVKEIGIRKVLGASISNVVLEISKGFIWLLLFAAIFAVPVAWFINDLYLQSFVNRINLGFGIFAFGIFMTFIVGFLIIFSQTIKSARVNPVECLRNE